MRAKVQGAHLRKDSGKVWPPYEASTMVSGKCDNTLYGKWHLSMNCGKHWVSFSLVGLLPALESDTMHPIWLRRQRGKKQREGNGAGACG